MADDFGETLSEHFDKIALLRFIDPVLARRLIAGHRHARAFQLDRLLDFAARLSPSSPCAGPLLEAVRELRPRPEEFMRLVLLGAFEDRLLDSSALLELPRYANALELLRGWGLRLLRGLCRELGVEIEDERALDGWNHWHLPLLLVAHHHYGRRDRALLRLILKLHFGKAGFSAGLIGSCEAARGEKAFAAIETHNRATRAAFEGAGLDYRAWLSWEKSEHLRVEDHAFSFEARAWRRLPSRDLFCGNEVRDCLAAPRPQARFLHGHLLDTGVQFLQVVNSATGRVIAHSALYPVVAEGGVHLMLDSISIRTRLHRFRRELGELMFRFAWDYADGVGAGSVRGVLLGRGPQHADVSGLEIRRLRARKLGGMLGERGAHFALYTDSWLGAVAAEEFYVIARPLRCGNR